MTTDETPTIKVTPEMLAAAHAQANADRAPTSDAPRLADDEDTVKTAAVAAVKPGAASTTYAPDAAAGDVAADSVDMNGSGSVADPDGAFEPMSAPAAEAPGPVEAPDDPDAAPRHDPTDLGDDPDAADDVKEVTTADSVEAPSADTTPDAPPAMSGESTDMPTDQADAQEAGAEPSPDALGEGAGMDEMDGVAAPDAVASSVMAQTSVDDVVALAVKSADDASPASPGEPTGAEPPTQDDPTAADAPIGGEADASNTSDPAAADDATADVTADVTADADAPADVTPDADEAADSAVAAAAPASEEPSAVATDAAPDAAPSLEARDPEFARYYAVRNHLGNLAFAPDSSQIAMIVNTSGQFNIWRQNVTGGWATQVTTFEDESARGVLWAPSGDLYGIADRAGSEQYDIFTIPATGGVTTYLTDRPDAQYELSEQSLSPDGRFLAYSGNDRQPTDGDVLVRDLHTGEDRRLLANGRYNVVVNWSPDGRYLTAVDLRSNTDLHVWLIDVATGEAREMLPHDDQFFLAPGPWLPDSSGFYVITDRGREFKGVARYRLDADAMEWVVAPEWDVEQLALSDDGRRLIWALNESGRSQLYLRDNDQAPLRVVGLPVGVFESLTLSPDGQTLALRINAATAPAEVYIVTLGPIGALAVPHLRRLTFGMLGGLEPSALVEPELVTFPTFDGRQIPAWVYRPRNLAPGQRAPLVVSIHGGPEAQERVEYKAFYQYLLAKGIGVLAPNVRGSTGYGLAYQKLIHRDWGGAELKDIQAAAEYAQTLSWVSPDRLGVYGGSFGGFATLSAVTRLPNYWAAAVDIVGPANLLTFVRSVPPTWRRMMAAWVGDPDIEADAALMRERSPITYVENVRAPLLVMQGANDPRVAKAESDQMVEQLRSMGREVEYVVFEDEGHGFTKRANTQRAYRLAANFFRRWLQV